MSRYVIELHEAFEKPKRLQVVNGPRSAARIVRNQYRRQYAGKQCAVHERWVSP